MKRRSVTKLDNQNKVTLKKNWQWRHVRIFSRHCFFPIYGQFGAIWKPDSERMVYKTYILINNDLLSDKNLKRKNPTQLSYYSFE